MESYLLALDRFSDEQVKVACKNILGKCGAFVPSASELIEECKAAAVYKVDPVKLARFRGESHEPPKAKLSEEERAANRVRVEKLIADWKAGIPIADTGPREYKPVWKPGPIGAMIAEDLMAMMPKEIRRTSYESEDIAPVSTEGLARSVSHPTPADTIIIEDDAPLF